MNLTVINRKNIKVPFDKNKIIVAIEKAMKFGSGRFYPEISREIADEIEQELILSKTSTISIYTIEEKVFNKLIEKGEAHTAKSYESYRSVKEYQREQNTADESILSLVKRSNLEVMNENSNKDAVLISTQRDLIAGEISKDISLRKLLPPHIVHAHKEGSIHVHDLDYFIQNTFNCCIINLGDMLQNETVINKRKIRKPNSFQVACTVATQIVAQISSNQMGGQSFDIKHLVPFVDVSRRKFEKMLSPVISDEKELKEAVDTLLKKEIQSGIQTISYQLNTLNSVNGQAPFVTIFMNLTSEDKNEDDLKMVIEEVLRQRIDGLENAAGVKITPAFPKLIYVLNEDTVSGGKYYDTTKLAALCTAKRSYPDYISAKKMKELYAGNVFSPMGCRSFLNPWKNEKGEYQFDGRLNIGVCSINLPQIAILANKNKEDFFKILDERLLLAKEVGFIRYNRLKNVPAKASPIHFCYGGIARLDPDEKIGKLLLDGRSTVSVGYIGLHETSMALIGKSITSDEGQKLVVEILNYMNKKLEKWREETRLYFSLYGTPSESMAGRFCSLDLKKYGEIEGVTDKGYYTNSYHVTPSEKIDAFSKLSIESQFQKLSTGGHIAYIEIPNMVNNIEAILSMMEFMYENMLYSEFNTRSDYCHVCGFDGEIVVNEDLEWECPQCHNKDKAKMNVIRRTCGYLGENFWTEGRTKDIRDRVLHL